MYSYDLVCTNGKWCGIIWRDGIWYYETDGYPTRDEANKVTRNQLGL